jgi:cell division protein YceG involved in septum cleavage
MAPADPSSRKLELFEIAPGAGFKTICHQLEERGFIRHWWSIDVIARMRGTDTQVTSGRI